MKIVGVISSPNPNDSTATLVREVLNGAADEGVTVTEIYLPKFQIEFCKGCSKCTAEGRCPIPDDFESLKSIIYGADGIIWSSPTYAWSMNAMLKRFLERLGVYEILTSSLGGKYMVGISTCGSFGAKKVAKNLVELTSNGIFQRSYISGFLALGLKGRKITDNIKGIKQANQLGRKIVSDIRNLKKYPLQNLSGRLVNALMMRPIFRKIILKQKDARLQAVFINLKQRGVL